MELTVTPTELKPALLVLRSPFVLGVVGSEVEGWRGLLNMSLNSMPHGRAQPREQISRLRPDKSGLLAMTEPMGYSDRH